MKDHWMTSLILTSSDDPECFTSKQAAFLLLHWSEKNCSVVGLPIHMNFIYLPARKSKNRSQHCEWWVLNVLCLSRHLCPILEGLQTSAKLIFMKRSISAFFRKKVFCGEKEISSFCWIFFSLRRSGLKFFLLDSGFVKFSIRRIRVKFDLTNCT